MKYELIVDGHAAVLSHDSARFDFQRESGESAADEHSIAPASRGTYSVMAGERSYAVTVLGDGEVSVNGRVFRVNVFDPRSMRGRKRAADSEGRQSILASMPGRIIRVLVEVGEEVAEGQGLIVVEAMKMQNEMKAPKAGRVVEVKTVAGAAVAAGELLAVIE